MVFGSRQRSIAAGLVAQGVDLLECTLLDAGGQWRGEAATLALGGGGAVGGARGGSSDYVDHEAAAAMS